MLAYIIRRLLSTVVVMTIVAVFVFLLLHLSAGDPAAIIAGDNATSEQIDSIRKKLGLDDPLPVQFIRWAGGVVSVLIMWTAFASVFSLMLGYSRVPYAAAADGNYFRAFAKVHPVHKFPYVSLLALAGVAVLALFLVRTPS